jgi:ribonuclease HI
LHIEISEIKKDIISCRLEFPCTNNTNEYEALLQGLRKEVDLKAEKIKVFGDFEIIIKQVGTPFIVFQVI